MFTSSKLWTRPFIVIVIMAFLFFLCLQILTAGFPAYITDMKYNPTQAGLMTTVFMLAAIITRPIFSLYIMKANLKFTSIISLILLAIAIGLSYGQESVRLLLFLRVLHGIGFGIVSTLLSTLATFMIPKNRLGEGIGYYGMATSVGTSIAPMLALSILQYWSYNLLIGLSVILTAGALMLSFFMKSPNLNVASTRYPNTATAQATEKKSFIAYAFDRKALVPCLLAILFTITLGGVISFLRELGKEVGLEGTTPLFYLALTIVMIAVRPISGRLFDNYGHKIIILPAILCGIIGLLLLAFTSNTPMLLLAGVCYGVAYGTVTPSLQAIAVSSVSREKHGTANAMFFSAMDLGVAIGSTGLGLLASATSYRFIYGFSVVSLIALLIAYSFTYLKIRRVESSV